MKRNGYCLLLGIIMLGSSAIVLADDQQKEAPTVNDPYAAGVKATQQARQNFEIQKNMDAMAFQKASEKPAPSPYKDAGGSEWQNNQKAMQNWNNDPNKATDANNSSDNSNNFTQNIPNPWAAPTPNTPPNNKIRPELQDVTGPNSASNIFNPPNNGQVDQTNQEPINIYK